MRFLKWLIGWEKFKVTLGLGILDLTVREQEALIADMFPNQQLRLF